MSWFLVCGFWQSRVLPELPGMVWDGWGGHSVSLIAHSHCLLRASGGLGAPEQGCLATPAIPGPFCAHCRAMDSATRPRVCISASSPVLLTHTWKTADLKGGRGSFSRQNLPGVARLLRAPSQLSGRHVLTVCKAHPLYDPPVSYSVP